MVVQENRSFNILVADDDSDDRQMLKEAFEENKLVSNINFVEDGEELINFLNHKGKFSNLPVSQNLDLILLDLNMPKKDGREVLREIKSDPRFKKIPVIVLTTSKIKEDILNSYDLGVNCYITKPTTYSGLIEITDTIAKYWFELAQLPNSSN